jgi:hypothetical protein
MIMNDHTFALFIRVINAMKTGNMYHANGAQWCLHESGKDIVIDTQSGIVSAYNAGNQVKHAMDVRHIEQMLMSEQPTTVFTSTDSGYYAVKNAAQDILRAADNNGVYHFNGGQCTIDSGWGTIRVYDIGTRGQVTTTFMGLFASWKYVKATCGRKQGMSEATKSFFRNL